MSVETITLGCRLNFAESEAMRGAAPAGEDWIIVNSCAVTAEAVRQTRQAIRRARRERPEREDPRHRLRGPARARRLPRHARGRRSPDSRDFTAPLTVAAGFRQRVRSFVAVQTGCDHRCTFCTIWQARGPSRSLPFEAIRDAVARELDRGASGDRPHRRRHHQLRGRPRAPLPAPARRRARASSACACPRSTASRSTRPCSR